MSLPAGARVGPYEILNPLGEGGMGEVYRARDTRLGREVAVKVLPDSFAQHPDRLARFAREAQVLAALNHPHVAQIYGVEDFSGGAAIILELVDGPTLADRIAVASLPPHEAIPVAIQIAHALEAAHERGIVHRDLKPANVKLTADGIVKVLDFGIAKALDPAPASADAMNSPTLTARATELGVLLGTAAYMAPEQVRGQSVNTRADVWAFGVVLFEMLAGRRPFAGGDVADVLADILRSDPDWTALPSGVPAGVRRLLRRCLQKDPRQRLRHIGDARLELEEPRADEPVASDAPRGRLGERLAWAVGLVIVAVAASVLARWKGPDADAVPGPEMRLEVSTAATPAAASFALSPDGLSLVFTAAGSDGVALYLRPLGSTEARALPGTEGSSMPFWAPDGRSIGYFARNRLRAIDLDEGTSRELATVLTPAGGSWGADGTILYVPSDAGPVYRIPATGGTPVRATPERVPALATRFPHFLPGGRRFLFHVARGGEPPGVYLGELDSEHIRRILTADGSAVYAPRHLLFVRRGVLHAQAFDVESLELSGPVLDVAHNVSVGLVSRMAVSPSASGAIAYRTGTEERGRLGFFARAGTPLGEIQDDSVSPWNPELSHDHRRVIAQATVDDNVDLWALDLDRQVFNRVTDHPAIDALPIWTDDGRLVFVHQHLYIKHLDGRPDERLLTAEPGSVNIACDWSRDGRFMLFKRVDYATASSDLWALPLGAPHTAFPVVQSQFDERDGQFSPDGNWISYQSDEDGQAEIYIRPFPGPGERTRVSTAGGTQVRWGRDGRELFYIDPDRRLMAVALEPVGMGLRPRRPEPLFDTRIVRTSPVHRQQYVVLDGGQRFLINTVTVERAAPITVILNWKPPPS